MNNTLKKHLQSKLKDVNNKIYYHADLLHLDTVPALLNVRQVIFEIAKENNIILSEYLSNKVL